VCVFKASNPPQPCETPETRADRAGRRSQPRRSFDHTEPFMGNDWRMHPLLSRQIYLTERAGKRGGEEGGYGGGGGGGVGERESETRRVLSGGVFHLVLAGSRGAAPAESRTWLALPRPARVRSVCARACVCVMLNQVWMHCKVMHWDEETIGDFRVRVSLFIQKKSLEKSTHGSTTSHPATTTSSKAWRQNMIFEA